MFERLEWNIERKVVDIWSLYFNIWLVSWIFCICTLDLLLCRNSWVYTWRLGCNIDNCWYLRFVLEDWLLSCSSLFVRLNLLYFRTLELMSERLVVNIDEIKLIWLKEAVSLSSILMIDRRKRLVFLLIEGSGECFF